ncbi:MAG: hypothetical protein COA57_03700 [Flavobacteriales bacterium]|nr:MAG: hypothetical protein COA57_03700 [Flavobacteriales bacterium]
MVDCTCVFDFLSTVFLRFRYLSPVQISFKRWFWTLIPLGLAIQLACVDFAFGQNDFIRFDRISIKNGLSQSTVNCILQDAKGFMWFGTQDGLNRFDGYRFKVFYHHSQDTSSLADNYVRALYEDRNGNLWVGTDNGLSKFNPELQTFETFYRSENNLNGLSDNAIRAICESDDGTLWFATANGGLNAFDKKTKAFTHYLHQQEKSNSVAGNQLNCLFKDASGKIWIGTEGAGISVFHPEENTFKTLKPNSLCSSNIRVIFQDSKGRVWAGTDKGLALAKNADNAFQGKFTCFQSSNKNRSSISANVISSVFEDSRGGIWFGTDGGGLNKAIFENGTLSFIRYRHEPELESSLSNDDVLSINEDRSGSLWFGTYNGISKFDPMKQYFAHYKHVPNNSNSLNNNNVWALCEDRLGMLWIGTRKGLSSLNRKTGKFSAYTNISNSTLFQNSQSILSVFEDSKSNIWLGTVEGVYRLQLSTDRQHVQQFIPVNYSNEFFSGKSENKVYEIFEDNKGLIWIGTRQGLAWVNPKTGTHRFFQHDSTSSSISNNTVRTIHQDRQGNLWIGTENGLNQLRFFENDSVTFKAYKQQKGNSNSLNNDLILSICEDEDGILWIGTYGGGLNRFNPEKEAFSHITEKDGLANNVIYGILDDEKGNLWLSTNKGISMYDPYSGEIKNFEENDGLQSNEFNIGAFFKNRNGELFFGGISGFNIFNPKIIQSNAIPPQMSITDFYLFNKPIEAGPGSILKRHISTTNEITLTYKQNNFSIEFAALHFSSPEKNKYQYKMVGFDKDWVDAGNRRIAHYTNLNSGEYTFIVKGSNSDNIWSDKPASFKITITPPFWKTWWFLFTLLLIAALTVYGAFQARVKIIEKQKIVLQRLVDERTVEIQHQKEKIEAQNIELEQEKEKAENLLMNMLPQDTVEELQSKGKARARSYRTATVMFTDIKNFTQISENLRPKDLVAELDRLFVKYDEIIEKYNIEKIKTIGDAYMCVGGIPIRNKTNPVDVALAALEIQQFMKKLKKEKEEKGEKPWEIRIGIHTGELTAGVIGMRRFSYDVWGDTVNVANRMEQSCEVGKVNISGKTHAHIKSFFECPHRGKINAKNKGEVDMYYVTQIKPEFSVKGEGKKPNDVFWDYVNLELFSSINYMKAERYVLKRLENELSDDLHYHGIHHTKDVCNAVERIAKGENIKGEELFILKSAALYHDAGFVKKYMGNEELGAQMAREVLPKYGYSEQQLDVIEQLILATKLPQAPQNHLEEIICDADLDYLGRDDFHTIADTLRREFLANNIVKNHKAWDELQIKFLSGHRYFTDHARSLRREKKLQHLKEVRERYERNEYPIMEKSG